MTYIVDKRTRLTGFEENQFAENTPVAQVSAIYGLRDDVFTTVVGGATVSASNGLFELSSGTSPFSIATIATRKPITYRPGEATCNRFTSIFTAPLIGLDQIAGLLNTESLLGFAYVGLDFGIIQARNGLAENQKLQITTPAAGGETATVTVNGVGYSVPITSGTTEHNAFEIATSLNTQVPNYEFSSNQDMVEAAASLPFPAGAFAFVSVSATGVWNQVTAGQAQTDIFIPQAEWNGGTVDSLDPLKLNTCEIIFDGNIQFYLQEQGGDFILVHTIEWSNTQVELFMRSPSQRVGWGIRNVGNTTNAVLKGGYAAGFIQGKVSPDEPPHGACVTEAPVSTTETTLLVLRNRLTFDGIPNRAMLKMLDFDTVCDTNKFFVLKAYINPVIDTTSGDLIFSYVKEGDSIAEVATNNIQLAAGQVPLSCYAIPGGVPLSKSLALLELFLQGRDTIVFTGQVSSGAAATASLSFNWREDL